jgi:hypothetical protein
MFIICLHTKFHVRVSSGLFVFAFRPEAECMFRAAAVLLT